MKCSQKVWYPNAVLAEEARRKLVQCAGHDHAQKRLVVYPCRDCGKFHVGHLRRSLNTPVVERNKPEPTPEKLPTWGQLRRKFERLEERWDAHMRWYGMKLIERIQREDAEFAKRQKR